MDNSKEARVIELFKLLAECPNKEQEIRLRTELASLIAAGLAEFMVSESDVSDDSDD